MALLHHELHPCGGPSVDTGGDRTKWGSGSTTRLKTAQG